MTSHSFTELLDNFIGVISASYLLTILTFTVLLGNVVYVAIWIIHKYCARYCPERKMKGGTSKTSNTNHDELDGD